MIKMVMMDDHADDDDVDEDDVIIIYHFLFILNDFQDLMLMKLMVLR